MGYEVRGCPSCSTLPLVWVPVASLPWLLSDLGDVRAVARQLVLRGGRMRRLATRGWYCDACGDFGIHGPSRGVLISWRSFEPSSRTEHPATK